MSEPSSKEQQQPEQTNELSNEPEACAGQHTVAERQASGQRQQLEHFRPPQTHPAAGEQAEEADSHAASQQTQEQQRAERQSVEPGMGPAAGPGERHPPAAAEPEPKPAEEGEAEEAEPRRPRLRTPPPKPVVRDGTARALFFLHAQTAMHPGAGTAIGPVDLPIQRERHTQWPTIAATAIKGVLRDVVRQQLAGNYAADQAEAAAGTRRTADEEEPLVTALFGSARPEEGSTSAGALCISDARILAFPVRSACGLFAWVSCPAVLERLERDLALLETELPGPIPELAPGQAACSANSPLLIDGQHMMLEEFDFTRGEFDLEALAEWIAQCAIGDRNTQRRLQRHFVLVGDEEFAYFTRHGTEVRPRIGLDYQRKTVKPGALFYEEFLPPETLFYSLVLVAERRQAGTEFDPARLLSELMRMSEARGVVQIGAAETTGKGLCAVRWQTF